MLIVPIVESTSGKRFAITLGVTPPGYGHFDADDNFVRERDATPEEVERASRAYWSL